MGCVWASLLPALYASLVAIPCVRTWALHCTYPRVGHWDSGRCTVEIWMTPVYWIFTAPTRLAHWRVHSLQPVDVLGTNIFVQRREENKAELEWSRRYSDRSEPEPICIPDQDIHAPTEMLSLNLAGYIARQALVLFGFEAYGIRAGNHKTSTPALVEIYQSLKSSMLPMLNSKAEYYV